MAELPGGEALKAVSARIAADVYDIAKGAIAKVAKHTISELEIGFSSYIEASYRKYSKVKTIINRFQPVSLVDIYEDCSFSYEDSSQIVSEDEIWESKDGFKRLIVSGTAGSGKSLFMKRSFLRFCEVNYGILPVLIELRSFNQIAKPSIKQCIHSILCQHIGHFDEKVTNSLLRSGKIVIFLDGYDELYSALKRRMASEISDISYSYPKARIIVSGRPDERFSSWSEFEEVSIAPLTKRKCLNLIDKAVHPQESKNKFYNEVRDSLFETHREYLVNPLMTYVMLFTSDQFVDFPTDVGAFYSKAFETLVRGHDVMKSDQFVREVNCDIKIKDIEGIFGYFCALSFKDQCYDYTPQQAKKYLKTALMLCNSDNNEDKVLEDFEKSYCLLIFDASKYNFIHRTFQEYFAASCVNSSEVINYLDYNNSILNKDLDAKRYFSMLKGVGEEKFMAKFFSLVLSEFLKSLYPIRNRNPKKFLSLMVQQIGVDESGSIRMVRYGEVVRFFVIAYTLFPLVRPGIFSSIFDEEENILKLNEIEYSEMHGMKLKIVDISKHNARFLAQLNIYSSLKSLVERAKIMESELGRRTAKLKRMIEN